LYGNNPRRLSGIIKFFSTHKYLFAYCWLMRTAATLGGKKANFSHLFKGGKNHQKPALRPPFVHLAK
jgi:hypothetical protein